MTEKKYLIDLDKLQLGDILLTISDRATSEKMNAYTKCPYHHAIIILARFSYIHSADNGVQSGNPAYLTFELPSDVILLRLKEENYDKITAAINSVRSKVGTSYSIKEMLQCSNATIYMDAKQANRQFCTRLVAQAYDNTGIKLVDNPDYCSPQDLRTSPLLEVSENVLFEGSEQQLKKAREGSKHLLKQEDLHNIIFSQAREVTNSDIQTFEQLETYIFDHPESDEILSDIIEKSGYLDLWKDEMEINSELYDANAFRTIVPKERWIEIAQECQSIAYEEENNFLQLEFQMEMQREYTGYRYHQLYEKLYANLVYMFRTMKETMIKVQQLK